MAINYTTSFNINVDDLQYILKQIKIAEATSLGYTAAPLSMTAAIIAAYGGDATSAALLPAGLRTVNGSFNNLLIAPTGIPGTPGYNPGTSLFGAADTLFPRLTDPVFQTVNGPGIDFNGDGIIDVINHNYGVVDVNPALPGIQPGVKSVVDVDPRLISNLIVDMSVNNPAAIAAYLDNPLSLKQFAIDHPGKNPVAPGGIVNPNDLELTNADLATIPNQSPDIGLSPGFNSWMTFFGQFFDHGLDLVTKGSNGTVYIPLTADDPLYDKGADHIANNVVDAFFVSDPTLVPPGAPLPAVSGVPSAWQAFYATDPADRASYPPGSFSPALTATPSAWAVKFNDDGAGADGLFSTADDKPNFMALTRATVTLDANGVPQTENTTTPWIDQNQTYTSNASHQVFLREYTKINLGDANGLHTVATGRLIDGTAASGSSAGAIGNWGEVKAQAIEMLGIKLSDHDVNNVPLLRTDQYGKFIPNADGFAQVTVQVQIVNDATGKVVGTQGLPFFMDGVAGGLDLANLAVPTTGLPVLAAGLHYQTATVGTNHAFLNDIAHHAAPGFVDLNHDGFKESKQTADTDQDTNHNGKFDFVDNNNNNIFDAGDTTTDVLTDVNGDGFITTADFFADDGNALTYDDEMLESHFITGDGRGNENIGLSSVHSIFHSEHNRAVEANKATILAAAADATLNSADHTLAVAFLNEWLLTDVAANATAANIAALTPASLVWDGERLFQAARFSTEMQYQHLVFEEFARRIQPAVNPFVFSNSPDLDPTIVAEFAHTVYRFGHSMLTGTVDRLDANLNPLASAVSDPTSINGQQTLLAVFLNPQAYSAGGVDAATINADLIRGLSRDVGNALDEFIVTDVRNTLVGLPLDLAALNIARGRETGIPSLNETRSQLFAGTGLADLKPYANWAEFADNISNPMSVVNFIAAYGNHASILSQTTTAGMRDAAMKLVFGDSTLTGQAAIDFENDRLDFINHTGTYASDTHLGGMNDIDLWIGGLAEAHPQFGGMLGTTFNYVFEYQLESLQNGDRFYYLSRTQGLNILNQLEPNTFSDIVMRNSELGDIYSTHLNGFLFVTPDHFLELDRGIAQTDYNGSAPGKDPLWAAGEVHSPFGTKVTRSYAGATTTVDTATGITHDVGGTLKYIGGEHLVVGGTEGNDKIWTDKGIDTLWGDGGDDYLNAGTESDNVFGGAGDDIIEDPFGDDMLRGNQGNDVITSARGADLFFGDQGQDFIMVGQDASEVFAGQDDDFILGGAGADGLMGNEGDDWIEGGEGFDGISGENSQLFFNSTIIGHDVLNGQGNDTDYDGESGDDIMFEGAGIQRNNGMFGFDWGIHKGDLVAANSDLGIPIFATQQPFTLRDRFDSVEGLSGWKLDDTLTGAALARGGALGFGAGPGNPADESDLKAKNVHLINGLKELLGISQAQLDAAISLELAQEAVTPASPTAARSSSIISIAQGAEIIIGGGGSDTIKGNLGNDYIDGDAWLNVRIEVHANKDGTGAVLRSIDSLNEISADLIAGIVNPGQLKIVREILYANSPTDIDTAVYSGALSNYTIAQNTDGSIQVTDNRAAGTIGQDGSDRLNHIERLQFADQTVSLVAPVITSDGGGATAAINFAENGTAPVTTVIAGAGVTFSLSGIDAAKFSINATTGVLSFINPPNFEAPIDVGANNVYDVIVTATGALLSDTQALAITVTNVVEVPVITSNGGGVSANINIAENSATVTTVTALADAAFPIVYSLNGGADAAKFSINATTGALTFINAPNFEAPTDVGPNNVYDVVVRATGGALFVDQALAVTVTNVDEAATGAVRLGYTLNTNILGNTTSASINATNNVVDPDGFVGTPTYQWQSLVGANFVNIVGQNSATLSNQTNATVRAVLNYNDPFGAKQVISAETAIISANNAANTAVGTANADILLGLGGADVLTGNGGNDTVDGGSGNDRIVATVNDGNDTYFGGTGTDTYDFRNITADVTVNLNLGTSSSTQTGTDTLSSIENVLAGNGNNTLTDGAGVNRFDGGTGNDTFIMTNDNASDDIRGGNGNDTVNYSAFASNLNFALNGTGTSNVIGSGTALTSDVIRNIENVIGGSGNDTITGDNLANILNGGAGNDTIAGGTGADVLTGGLGSDTFVYSAINQTGVGAATRDVITDFVSGTDKLDFSGIDADIRVAAVGNQAFTFNATAGAAFTGPAQLVFHYEGAGANEITVIQGNVNNNLNPEFEVALLGHITFNAATDIIL